MLLDQRGGSTSQISLSETFVSMGTDDVTSFLLNNLLSNFSMETPNARLRGIPSERSERFETIVKFSILVCNSCLLGVELNFAWFPVSLWCIEVRTKLLDTLSWIKVVSRLECCNFRALNKDAFIRERNLIACRPAVFDPCGIKWVWQTLPHTPRCPLN